MLRTPISTYLLLFVTILCNKNANSVVEKQITEVEERQHSIGLYNKNIDNCLKEH